MNATAASGHLAAQARRLYADQVIAALPALAGSVLETIRALLDKPAVPAVVLMRRDLFKAMERGGAIWQRGVADGLYKAMGQTVAAARAADLPLPGAGGLSLVDDDTIEREILTSRLALAVMDRASWEFSDLRSRLSSLERRNELDANDPVRAHVLARIALEAWRGAGMSLDGWRELQSVLHEEFAHAVEEAYHEANRWLVEQRVMPEIDLRPLIRRSRGVNTGGMFSGALGANPGDAASTSVRGGLTGGSGGATRGVGEETRLMTRAGPLRRENAGEILSRLNRLVGRQMPGFGDTAHLKPVSPALAEAINSAQVNVQQRLVTRTDRPDAQPISTPQMLAELQQRKQALKQAATTPVERATIEIVAMMFQSILTEDRIPATIRVWFARLQMPTLRVAVSEPDFFATIDHPARRLIDRMGACVMGFDSSSSQNSGEALSKEIKRVVQVVEAYPDTGRRVFQTVLVEFEKFLQHYFKNENEASRKGVSLAQQIEQRETLAIQYTIELRKMLNEVPVQDEVRQFLFQVWADVLATTAVRYGAQADQTKAMKKAATEVIWSAGAKVTREERAEVLRRLPPLLKTLRDGMASAGMSPEKQDEHIQTLNNSLAAAFTAKAAVISSERIDDLTERLESLEELLPDADNVQIDESLVLDLSGHESSEIEVVGEGGSMPTPAMVAWARELQVGSWFMLDYRNRNEPVQLAWQGLRKQLSLFATPQGRCVLFHQQRLAAFLQAGLLLPAQEESLTVRATRTALAKLDADPSRLLN
ncbi:MAG: DUF1631 family protein [Burkholderiaceae bacterium]|nr:MAG: DUF1631 domain-containing protein [Burkholderiaceae bacterium]MBE7426116.1 DUF1631 family protein [Ideonella sp.]MCC7286931.1 DUF1631 family protein [Burkholderiaceae bacterium]